MFSQSLGLRSQKDGGPLGGLEGVGSQTACLPRAVQGLKLDLELENFGLGVGGQAGEMRGPWVSGSGLSHGWERQTAALTPSSWRRPGGHRAQRAPVWPPRPSPSGLWSLLPIVREIMCEAAWLPSEATEPVALGVSF